MREFADAGIANLGVQPEFMSPADFQGFQAITLPEYTRRAASKKELKGVDVFVDWRGQDPDDLAAKLQVIENPALKLSIIRDRGVKVWPNGFDETFLHRSLEMPVQCFKGRTGT